MTDLKKTGRSLSHFYLNAKSVLVHSLIFVLYFLTAKIGLELATINQTASPVWPATGMALGLLIIFGPKYWAAVFIGAFAANIQTGLPFWATIFIGTGNTLEALSGFYIYKLVKTKIDPVRSHFYPVPAFILSSVMSPILSATIGSLTLLGFGLSSVDHLSTVWLTWWVGDGLGALLVTPLIYRSYKLYKNKTLVHGPAHYLKLFILALALILPSCYLMMNEKAAPLLFIIFPLLLAAHYLGSPLFSYFMVSLIGTMGVVLTSLGRGPFIIGSVNDNLIHFQIFTAGIGLTALVFEYLKFQKNSKWTTIALLIGWLFSGISYYSFFQGGLEKDREHFKISTEKIEKKIQSRIFDYIQAIDSGAALISMSHQITDSHWKKFVEKMNIKTRYPGVNGLGLIFEVPTNMKNDFLDFQRKNHNELKIHSPLMADFNDSNRQNFPYWIITHIEPLEKNQPALGLDISSEITRRKAALFAKNNNTAQMTGSIPLVQDLAKRPGFLLLTPFNNTHSNEKFRRGFVYIPIISQDFFKAAVEDLSEEIDMRVTSENGELLFQTQDSAKAIFESVSYLNLSGQKIRIDWKKSILFKTMKDKIAPWVGLIGCILSLLLAIIVSNLQNLMDEANTLADEKSQKLAMAQLQIAASERLSSLGQMAAGIAHEINNPLSIIQGRSFQIQKVLKQADFNNPELVRQNLLNLNSNISLTVQRISRIIKSLRLISRDGQNDPLEATSLKQIIENTFELCQEKFKSQNIKLNMEPIPDIFLNVREVQICQVLTNLMNNAFDAIETQENKWISVQFKNHGNSISIYIVDSGPGISEELEKKILTPFFTTKDPGKGTGLGLSISRAIINEHQGQLILNRSFKNTCFEINLPMAPNSVKLAG